MYLYQREFIMNNEVKNTLKEISTKQKKMTRTASGKYFGRTLVKRQFETR